MKYSDSLRESLIRDFFIFADKPPENILAYYEKGSIKDLNFSVVIYEDEGIPFIASTQHLCIYIPFDLESILKNKK
jgi:hypothetical protein